MEKLTAKNFTTTNWAGGTTTEMFIWPKSATFLNRNFDFRISTATVQVETSVFTPLAGVTRTLMVLAGEMKLIHEGHHSVTLGAFEVDKFDGSWTTKSIGKCSDLNLMCRGNATGKLTHFELVHQEVLTFNLQAEMNLIYVYRGSISLGKQLVGLEGDLIILDKTTGNGAVGLDACDFVLIEIDGLAG